MEHAAIILATPWAAGVIWLAYLVRNAPGGWEDSSGFHVGSPPQIADGEGTPLGEVFRNLPGDHPNGDRFAGPLSSLHGKPDSAGGAG